MSGSSPSGLLIRRARKADLRQEEVREVFAGTSL
jgi:hypothetical protein